MIQLTYKGTLEHNNSKGLLFQAAMTVNYAGSGGAGDLLNFEPYNEQTNPNGVLDPNGSYDQPIAEVPGIPPGVFSESMGGYYAQIQPNAVPTLTNYGLRFFGAQGSEVANGAYPASITGGFVILEVLLPLQ